MLGLYPVLAQTAFLIGSPWFANTTISLGDGKLLAITSVNGSESSFYVQSLRVNGEPWTKSWLTWNYVFENGESNGLCIGSEPSELDYWTPSPASEHSITTTPSVIAPPGKVPTSSSLAVLREQARKHKELLRRVAFAMMIVGIVLMSAASFAVWWFCLRMRKSVNTEPAN